jgi:hypothetical protein
VDRAIGITAVALLMALVLPGLATAAEHVAPALGLLLICLLAIRVWLAGFGL